MNFRYIQNCPSCGAPIELDEADRVIDCDFCDGKNYMIHDKPLRFILPHLIPREIDPEDIFYIPYLRFKGHIYSCQGKEVTHKIIDTTQLGIKDNTLPVSLGLRPQAMKIKPVSAHDEGGYLRLTEKAKAIFQKAAKLTSSFSKGEGQLYHRAFIGETISYIYLPVYFKFDILYDGVLNRMISNKTPYQQMKENRITFNKVWLPRFISLRCPHCAETMHGETDSIVLECKNCDSLWYEELGKLTRAPSYGFQGGPDSHYLPFWKIEGESENVNLRSFADFLKISNHPVVIQKKHEMQKMCYYIPAFKLKPQKFLALSKRMTVSQLKISLHNFTPTGTIHPANLPLDEAVQSLKTVLAYSILDKKMFFPHLSEVQIQANNSQLVYLPFIRKGLDLQQKDTLVSVNISNLRYGRSM